MKKFITFLLILLSITFKVSYGQLKLIADTDLRIKNLFENYTAKSISSVTLYRYDIDDGIISEESERISKTIVDAEKNIFTDFSFYPNYSKSVITLDGSKNVKDASIFYSDNSLMSRVITNYESDGRMISKIYYFGNSMTFRVNNKYSSGKIANQDYIDSAGKKISYSNFYYDGENRLIEEDKYNQNDSLEIIFHYMYDNNGNCTEESVNYPSSNFSTKTVYTYDEKGNKTEMSNFGIGGKLTSKTLYKYNDAGLLIDEASYSIDNKMTSENVYRYDENGNKIEWRYFDISEDVEFLYKVVYNEK